MKYTRKVPYFKKGDRVKKRIEVGNTGKTREEILAEAKRNQSIERKQQIAGSQREGLNRVGAGFQKPTATVNMPVNTRSAQIENTVGQTVPKTRGQAFQQVRERGDKEAAGTSLPSNTTTNAVVVDPTTSVEQTSTTESTNGGSSSG